jgi:hypothetical protein
LFSSTIQNRSLKEKVDILIGNLASSVPTKSEAVFIGQSEELDHPLEGGKK